VTRNELRDVLANLVAELSTHPVEFEVRRAASKEFFERGEYSSNIAFALAAKIKASPNEVAEQITNLWPRASRLRDEIEITAQRGFLNFRMSDNSLHQSIHDALSQGRDYGANRVLDARRVNVEFVSADPTGPLDLQHGRLAVSGDALCHLLASCGASVTREYFLNDIETSSKLKLLGESVAALYLAEFGQSTSSPEGAQRDPFTQHIARDLAASRGNELLLLPEDERISVSTHEAREAIVAGQKSTLKKLGVHFDVWTSESALRRDRLIEAIIEKLRDAGHTYESGGALWLRSTTFGDEADRPLVRASGEYTYLAADIAYHAYRLERNFDLLINIWTSEHRPYVPRTHAALKAAGFADEKLEVLVCEDARLLRDGETVQSNDSALSLDDALGEVDAENLRFLLLLSEWDSPAAIETEIATRDDESNPAYAARLLPSRLSTLLRQAESAASDSEQIGEAEKQLARFVALWPEEVESAARERRPQRIAKFVLEMSEAAHDLVSSSSPGQPLSSEVLRAAQVVAGNALRICGLEPRENF
jgi:arginyl-tRNA synthetase